MNLAVSVSLVVSHHSTQLSRSARMIISSVCISSPAFTKVQQLNSLGFQLLGTRQGNWNFEAELLQQSCQNLAFLPLPCLVVNHSRIETPHPRVHARTHTPSNHVHSQVLISSQCNHNMCPLAYWCLLHQSGHQYFGWYSFYLGRSCKMNSHLSRTL